MNRNSACLSALLPVDTISLFFSFDAIYTFQQRERSSYYSMMVPYAYTPLNTKKAEIRLIQLVRGKAGDVIVFCLIHAPLIKPQESHEDHRLSIKKLHKTLPDDWLVRETLDGRYLFMVLGTSGRPNTWTHPDPSFNRALYKISKPTSIAAYKPEYEALSYSWGPTGTQTLFIDQNLAYALRFLHSPEKTRTWCVDAVCINQQDIDKRNAQIRRIGDIYSLAQKVIIWLGPESDNSTYALSTLIHFAQHEIRGCSWSR